jgi:membrane protein implicated in regulation of membrane protease activity
LEVIIMGDLKTNADEISGSVGIVIEEISRERNGRVRMRGTTWEAFTDEAIPLRVGEKVLVLAIDGVKLKVKRKEAN